MLAPMTDEPLDYQELVREALRDVVRRSLEIVAEEGGLPGDHFFYVSFRPTHPGVRVPAFLRDSYPDEVTIILQHQFWDLEVDREAFSVSLNFNASRQRVTVPYEALTSFVDPSAEFGLRFGPLEAQDVASVKTRGPRSIDREPRGEAKPVESEPEAPESEDTATPEEGGKIAGVLPFPTRRR